MWRNGAIKTKWMLISEDIKHIMLDFHSSIVNTKSSLKYKSFSHRITKGIYNANKSDNRIKNSSSTRFCIVIINCMIY